MPFSAGEVTREEKGRTMKLSPRDEHLWEQAKQLAADAGHPENWAYVNAVFKRSGGRHGTRVETLPVPTDTRALAKAYVALYLGQPKTTPDLRAFSQSILERPLEDLQRLQREARETQVDPLFLKLLLRGVERYLGALRWIRKENLSREDGSTKNITVGTRVRVHAQRQTYGGTQLAVPAGAGVVEEAASGSPVSARQAKEAVGTTAALRVRLDPESKPAPTPRVERLAAQPGETTWKDHLSAWPEGRAKIGATTILFGVYTLLRTPPFVEIQSVRTPPAKRGKGAARHAMETFLAAVDRELGYPVVLGASPLDKKTKLSRLVTFYQGLGFELTGKKYNPDGDPEMRRPGRGHKNAPVERMQKRTSSRSRAERPVQKGVRLAYTTARWFSGQDTGYPRIEAWSSDEELLGYIILRPAAFDEMSPGCFPEIEHFRRTYPGQIALGEPGVYMVMDALVDRDHRRQGVAVQLYQEAVREAARRHAVLVANACEEAGATEDAALALWASGKIEQAAGIERQGLVAFAPQKAQASSRVERMPVAPRAQENPCKRCNGSGVMPYPHVWEGRCFRCDGSGVEPKEERPWKAPGPPAPKGPAQGGKPVVFPDLGPGRVLRTGERSFLAYLDNGMGSVRFTVDASGRINIGHVTRGGAKAPDDFAWKAALQEAYRRASAARGPVERMEVNPASRGSVSPRRGASPGSVQVEFRTGGTTDREGTELYLVVLNDRGHEVDPDEVYLGIGTGYVGTAEQIADHLRRQAWSAENVEDVPTEFLPRKGRAAFIEEIEADPAYQGQGWGRRIWESFVAAAHTHGASRVYLWATPASVTFWQAMGFRKAWGYYLERRQAPGRYPARVASGEDPALTLMFRDLKEDRRAASKVHAAFHRWKASGYEDRNAANALSAATGLDVGGLMDDPDADLGFWEGEIESAIQNVDLAGPPVERMGVVVSSPVVYHGTSLDRLPAILRQGLRPRKEHGRTSRHTTKTTGAVFATDSLEGAWLYADADRTRAAILEIDPTGLDFEPDFDDVGVLLEDDLRELRAELKHQGWDRPDRADLTLGADLGLSDSDFVDAVDGAIERLNDFAAERSVPVTLEVSHRDGPDGESHGYLYAVPYTTLPVAEKTSPDLADDYGLVYEDGVPHLQIQQYLCRCAVRPDQIRSVLVWDHVAGAWGAPGGKVVDYGQITGGDEGMVNGRWGSHGAGMLFTTGKKILLLQRSWAVQEPGTWGIAGGAVRQGETNLEQAARQEVREEQGTIPPGRIVGKTMFQEGRFTYTTFIVRVAADLDQRYEPKLNWESSDWGWFAERELSGLDLHPGVVFTLQEADDLVFGKLPSGVFADDDAATEEDDDATDYDKEDVDFVSYKLRRLTLTEADQLAQGVTEALHVSRRRR